MNDESRRHDINVESFPVNILPADELSGDWLLTCGPFY